MMITEKQKQAFKMYWERENEVPLLSIYAKKTTGKLNISKKPKSMYDRWLDVEYVIKVFRNQLNNTYYGGTAFPFIMPNFGPDILGAICGCEIEFGENTSWAIHNVHDWAKKTDIVFDENNKWWKKICGLTKALLDDSKGDYEVGITDLHPGLDALVSLRGPENLCIDLLECPELVVKFEKQVFDVYKKIYDKLFEITSVQGGVMTWIPIWSDKKWYVTGCDFSCLISTDSYNKFVAPAIERELDFLDQSIYHLDGPQALRHLDSILNMEKLKGVQWVYGAGQPSASHWLDVLKKIQAAKKTIDILVKPEDIKILCENLSPKGLHMNCYADSEDEAKALEKIVETTRKF